MSAAGQTTNPSVEAAGMRGSVRGPWNGEIRFVVMIDLPLLVFYTSLTSSF
jgi:hypothetical protein